MPQDNCPPGGCPEPFIVVHPNPTTESLTVSFNEVNGATSSVNSSSEIRLMDSQGTNVQSLTTNEKEATLPVTGLRNGIYYLVVSSGGKYYQRQVVIKH